MIGYSKYQNADLSRKHTPIMLQTPTFHTFVFQPPNTQAINQSIEYSINQSTIWAIGSADSQPGTLVFMTAYQCGRITQDNSIAIALDTSYTPLLHEYTQIHTECIP